MTQLAYLQRGDGVTRDGVFSEDRRYRYVLTRRWDTRIGAATGVINFVGLNPSTADETVDDPTIRRCVRFARDWGYAALVMTNLFAYRSTDWRQLRRVPDPVGDDNLRHLREQAHSARTVVAAWGAHGVDVVKGDAVHQFVDLMLAVGVLPKCLGRTSSCQPRHPLFMPAIAELEAFWP